MSENREFYARLKPFKTQLGFFDPGHYVAVPADWHIVITDVRNSTVAIEQGRYKDVNLIGVSTITAVVNALQREAIPYVFGGDGATFLIPPGSMPAVREALLAVKKLSSEQFGLELRAGAVSVADAIAAGHALSVAKYLVSDKVSLALFSGTALTHAEAMVKGADAERYEIAGIPAKEADLTGLECRWKPIQNRHGQMLSVLIRATAASPGDSLRVYKEVIEEIEVITGLRESIHPAPSESLKIALNPLKLRKEERLKEGASLGQGGAWRRKIHFYLGAWFAWLLIRFRMKAFGVDWGAYRDDVSRNSDFWKYDEVLRFVIDVSDVQRRALLACFDARLHRGEMLYGTHSSEHALMTCMVHDRAGNHLHFIDGGDGGYAMAAKELKKRAAAAALPDARVARKLE